MFGGLDWIRKLRRQSPVNPWEYPEKPWHRLHIDYAGPFHGLMWLIVVDARSKWPEIFKMKVATTQNTIDALWCLFGRFGIPKQIVSDNGSVFTSQEFKKFCERLNIHHIRSSPYHPRTNGEAERFVRTFKEGIGKFASTSILSYSVNRFLLSYRNTPNCSTGYCPSKLYGSFATIRRR